MRTLIWAVILLLVVVAPLSAQNADKSQSHQASASEGDAAKNPPISIVQNCGQAARPQENACPKQTEAKIDGANEAFWNRIATSLMAIGTLIIAVFAVIQARAAQDAVKAVHEGNEINRTSLQTVQRAYISYPISDMQWHLIKGDPTTGNFWQVRIALENTGNTPAINLTDRLNYQWKPGQSGLPDDYPFTDFGDTEIKYFSNLPSKGKIYSPKLTIPEAIITSLRDKQIRLFLFGWATYKDAFADTPLHRTEFCHEIAIMGVDANGNLAMEVSLHHKHNSQS